MPRAGTAGACPEAAPFAQLRCDEDYMHLGNAAARTGSPLAFEAIKYIRLGYTFAAVPLRPRLALRADVVSGDRTQLTAPSARLTPCSPRGNYFGEAAILGPHNLVDLHPMLQLHLSERVSREAGWTYYWRYSRRDGVYGTA